MSMRMKKYVAMGGAFLAVLFIKTTAATAACWYEAANWNPKIEEWQCLGWSCGGGWCCKICDKTQSGQ